MTLRQLHEAASLRFDWPYERRRWDLTLRLADVQHRVIESVLLAQPRHAVGLKLEPVSGCQLPELRRVKDRGLHDGPELIKEMLEAAR